MLRVGGLVVSQGGAVAVLVALRRTVAPASFADASTDDLVVFVLWVLALAIAGWLLVSTLAWLAIDMLPAVPPRARAAVATLTAPAIRVAVRRAALVSVAGTLATASTALADDATPSPGVRSGRAPALEEEPASPQTPPTGGPPAVEADAVVPAPPEPARAGPLPHRVEPGEHLWSIAVDMVRAVDAGAGDPEVARYWVRVIEENRQRLRSGDPDVVFPGEIILLPPV